MRCYKLLGTNQDHDTCSHCGRTGLKKVVWLDECDADGNAIGNPLPFGCNCAATLLRFGSAALWTKALQLDAEKARAESERVHEIGDERSANNFVVESIGQNGASVTRLCFANGLKSVVTAWARDRWPNLILEIRPARGGRLIHA